MSLRGLAGCDPAGSVTAEASDCPRSESDTNVPLPSPETGPRLSGGQMRVVGCQRRQQLSAVGSPEQEGFRLQALAG